MEKTCKTCGVTKPTAEFYACPSNRDGLMGKCKACKLQANAYYYRANPDKHSWSVRKTQSVTTDPDKQRLKWDRRRARKRAAWVEDVERTIVFERDAWTCQLCDEAVDVGIPWPGLASPSLDHIVPLANGGRHSYANTQLAHLGCNMSKGNRVAS